MNPSEKAARFRKVDYDHWKAKTDAPIARINRMIRASNNVS